MSSARPVIFSLPSCFNVKHLSCVDNNSTTKSSSFYNKLGLHGPQPVFSPVSDFVSLLFMPAFSCDLYPTPAFTPELFCEHSQQPACTSDTADAVQSHNKARSTALLECIVQYLHSAYMYLGVLRFRHDLKRTSSC